MGITWRIRVGYEVDPRLVGTSKYPAYGDLYDAESEAVRGDSVGVTDVQREGAIAKLEFLVGLIRCIFPTAYLKLSHASATQQLETIV